MLVYGAVAVFGFLVLLILLVAGDFSGDHDIGGHDIGGHETPGDLGHDGGGMSVFSVRVMASFVTAFGVGGLVARYYGLSHRVSSGVGAVSGVAMAGLVYQFARVLYSQQASSEIRMVGLVGRSAEVSVAIPASGVGQVSLTFGGERSEHIARTADGRALPRGTAVVITSIRGDSVVVGPSSEAPTGVSR
jgi:membrane protein implicated in regulation of membrane protease activity